MKTTRLEAFSDGVLAIIITIMVLELKVPQRRADLAALKPLLPVFLSYVLSFIYVGIYWNNHHHMFHSTKHVTGGILWANLHLLFWLSLFPFTTAWVGENHLGAMPTAVYGFVLLMAAIAYYISAMHHHQVTRPRLPPRGSHRQRLERQALAPCSTSSPSHSHSSTPGFPRPLHHRRPPLARPRPPHRPRPRRRKKKE